MHLILPDVDGPTRVVWADNLDDDQFYDLCVVNRDLRIERDPRGELVIAPPVGGESDYRATDLGGQLGAWSKRDGRGRMFGSSACFLLPDRAGLSPDGAWMRKSNLAALSKETRKKFLPVVPDFVFEVLSPTDRLEDAREKMEQWIANGVSLGWLIDGDRETVYVYRRGQPVREHTGIEQLEGEGPLAGFVAYFEDIWEGL